MFGLPCYNRKIQFMFRRIIPRSNLTNTRGKLSKRWDDDNLAIAIFSPSDIIGWPFPKSQWIRCPHTQTPIAASPNATVFTSSIDRCLTLPNSWSQQTTSRLFRRSPVQLLVCGDGQWQEGGFMWLWTSVRNRFLFRICAAKFRLFKFTEFTVWW
jgi:hypothetical protein